MFQNFNKYHALVTGYIILGIFAIMHPENSSDAALIALGGTWFITSKNDSSNE